MKAGRKIEGQKSGTRRDKYAGQMVFNKYLENKVVGDITMENIEDKLLGGTMPLDFHKFILSCYL